ncbi:MAG: NAD(P)H-dependent oxidoreductase [Synergistaceae bacterium]|nr:NAD(P)H-dependent oxidoreductase [Synergistaceae bacterium]
MFTTIIYAHPYEGSYNRAILNTVIGSLKARGKEYVLIDLYQDNFDPVLTKAELAAYSRGDYLDPLVGKYNGILDETEKAVLIFPIWWYDFPAIMKGFFDKVMLPGSSYSSGETRLCAIRHIPRTLIITTASASTETLIDNLGDTVNRMMIDTIFKAIGFHGAVWENFGSIGKSTLEERKIFLSKISALV